MRSQDGRLCRVMNKERKKNRRRLREERMTQWERL